MSNNEYKPTSGPFVIQPDGTMSDREIWESEMDPELELKFDEYLFMKAINKAAKEELARRKALGIWTK